MLWEELLPERHKELPPRYIISIRKGSTRGRRPPYIRPLLQGKGSQNHLILFWASDSCKDLLRPPYPILCNIWVALPLKKRRPHPLKPLHQRSSIQPIRVNNPLLVHCSCIAILEQSLKSC